MGQKPNPVDKLTETDYNNIDCLLCHAPGYKRVVVREGDALKFAPAPGVDVLKAAQGSQKPTSEMCLRCHLAVGGGPNHKHGVTPTSKESDVHVAKGMECLSCHTAKQHKIAGGSDLKAQELLDVKVSCSNCHTEKPHKGAKASYLNTHGKRISCQTCHIPAIARDPKFPTITERDWTKSVLNEKTGLYGPTHIFAANLKPVYRWWNGLIEPTHGEGECGYVPVGSLRDPKSKITPWKKTRYFVIADKATGKPVYIKAGTYAVTGDPFAAAKKGAEDGKQPYSGEWKGVAECMMLSVNHQVAPKTAALECNACHSATGVLDFKTLGYPADRIKKLSKGR
jgi:hypothetical protein